MANQIEDFHSRGGELAAVSVDSDGRNVAFARRWHLPFTLVSDPGGEQIIKPLDLWNERERGGIGVPAVMVISPDGETTHFLRSRDFADRPDDSDLLKALDSLALEPIEDLSDWEPTAEPEEWPGAFRADAFGAYFRGVMFSSLALSGRLHDEGDKQETLALSGMARSFLNAWKDRRAQFEKSA